MKRFSAILAVFLLGTPLPAMDIQALFEALKHNPNTKLDAISVKEAELGENRVYAKLYPKVTLFGRYDNFSSPTGALPVAPNSMVEMVQNPDVGQPFGYNIYRAGGAFSMPLFVKSIYTYADQAKMMQRSAKEKKQITLLQNEAIIVGTNASLLYLEGLEKSLTLKQHSLNETQKFVKINVQSGRAAESELYKINNALNDIDIALNNINLQRQKAYAQIMSLTGIMIEKPLPMEELKSYEAGSYRVLEPLRSQTKALQFGVKAEEERLWWPVLSADGKYSRSYTEAYNNGKNVYENYGQIGVTLAFPLYDKENLTALDEAKIRALKAQTQLEKNRLEFDADAHALQKNLLFIKKSVQLYTHSLRDKQHLLEISKVSFKNGRMATEEYLRYEDDLAAQQAKLYEAEALHWQTLMKLAVIYGNNIEEMVK